MSRRPPKSTRTASRCAYPTLFRSNTLLGVPQTCPQKGYSAFAPVIEVFLKEHLFADIFERDVLTYAERELVTVSVLAGIGGVEPMLRSHLNISLNVGFSPEQLQQFIRVFQSTVGKKKAKAAKRVLVELLFSSKKKKTEKRE